MGVDPHGHIIKVARTLLDWSQQELADRARCHVTTVSSLERNEIVPIEGTREKIVEALKDAGVEFVQRDNEKGAGVRFKTIDVEVAVTTKPYVKRASPKRS
jgi:ribosome-binding protein aMBF1 (putative translation factor)